MDLLTKLPEMSDDALANLRDNAKRLQQSGTAAQRSDATALLPAVEGEPHRTEHIRRLGGLDIAVLHYLDAIAPRIQEIEKGSWQDLPTGRLYARTHARSIVDDQPEMAAAIRVLHRRFHQVDELVAELDKGIPRPFRPQREVEDFSVELKRLLDVADFEGDMIDADEAGFRGVGLTGLGHARSFLLVRALRTHYIC